MKANFHKLFSAGMILVVTAAMVLSGCKPEPQPQPTLSLNGNVARPLWEAPVIYDYTSSMSVLLKVDLLAQYPEEAKDFELKNEDMVAAFMGEACLGVASPENGLFFLYISGPDAAVEQENITLRYYSTHYKNIFVAENVFPYAINDRKGLPSQPFVPEFVLESK